jgi:hypothetical protein
MAEISTGESGCSTTWAKATTSSGPVMAGLVVDSETLKWQASRCSGSWVAVAALNASKKMLAQESKGLIAPP